MATTTVVLANATRSNTTITSAAVAQPPGVGQVEFRIVGTNWTDPANVVRLEIWESPDGVAPFEFSFGGDFPGGYVPKPGGNVSPGFVLRARDLRYPRSIPADQLDQGEVLPTFAASRLQGVCIVTGTVRFHLDMITS
jgi:hypothetical protein